MADHYRVFPRSGSAEPEELRKQRFQAGPPAYHHHHAQYQQYGRRRRSFCCRCCCCLCTSIATLLLLIFIAASIVYLILNPKAPKFSVTRAYITEFNMTAQPIDKPADQQAGGAKQPRPAFYLQTDMNFTVQVKNPNKKVGIYFEHVDVGVGYEGVRVGRGVLAEFYVGVNKSRELEVQVKGRDTGLTEPEGAGLQKAMTAEKNQTMWVVVETAARASLRVWGQQSKAVKALVSCDVEMGAPLPHSSAHILSKACRLKLLSLMQ